MPCSAGTESATELLSPGSVEKVAELLASIAHPQACFVGGGAAVYEDP